MKIPPFLLFFVFVLGLQSVALAQDCRRDLPALTSINRLATSGTANSTGDLIWSPDCNHIYISNTALNQVDVYSMASAAWEAPIPAGAGPRGSDIWADGKLLFLANTRDQSISMIDLTTRAEVTRFPLPVFAEDVVVAANGMLIVAGRNAALKVNPYTGAVTTLVERTELKVGRSADRSLVIVSSDDRSFRYWADIDSFGQLQIGGFARSAPVLNTTGSVAFADQAYGDYPNSTNNVVVDARSGNLPKVGTLGERRFPLKGVALDPDGQYAYNLTDPSGTVLVEVIELKYGARKRSVNLGVAMEPPPTKDFFQPAPNVRHFEVSPDGNLFALAGRDKLVLMRTNDDQPSVRLSVFSLRFASIYSLLRFHNTGMTTGTAKVTLANYDTGAVVATWESPPIVPHAAPQFYIKDIEATASAPFVRPFKYIATIETTFEGTAAHVTWYPYGPLANASTCENSLTTAGRTVANVHSSRIGEDYPSEVGVVNTGTTEALLSLGVFDARDGRRLGTYSGGILAAGGAHTLTGVEIERGAGIATDPGMTHFVVALEGPIQGLVQHLVYHRPSGVLADLTPVCALSKP